MLNPSLKAILNSKPQRKPDGFQRITAHRGQREFDSSEDVSVVDLNRHISSRAKPVSSDVKDLSGSHLAGEPSVLQSRSAGRAGSMG